MKARHLAVIVGLLAILGRAGGITLGPSGWVTGEADPAGLRATFTKITVSAYDNVVVAICGDQPLSSISSITVKMTAEGDPDSIVADGIEIHRLDTAGGFNPPPNKEMVALYRLENFFPGTYDLHCQLAGLNTGTVVFGYVVLISQYQEYILHGFPSPGTVSGTSFETLNFTYQIDNPGGYALELISSNNAWTEHPAGAIQIFSSNGTREFYANKMNSVGFFVDPHVVNFEGTADAAAGIGVYFVGLGGSPEWKGYPIVEDGWVDTQGWLGWVQVDQDPFIYSLSLSGWLYVPESQTGEGGGWVYVYN